MATIKEYLKYYKSLTFNECKLNINDVLVKPSFIGLKSVISFAEQLNNRQILFIILLGVFLTYFSSNLLNSSNESNSKMTSFG